MTEEHTFKAEISELMNMIINNFYSNRDIFLRELISNSSDAINKLKHNSLQEPNILSSNYDFQIKIKLDKENKIITIEDSGLGMSRDDLINNLGTIAKSGTKEFLKKLSSSENKSSNDMIGQFGVGFYSAYLVADKVKVITRLAGTDDLYEWESNANGIYSLSKLEDNQEGILRGTKIILYIKSDAEEYLEDMKITEIIKKYSSYITYPIFLYKLETKEVPDDIEMKEEMKEEIKEEMKEEIKEEMKEEIKEEILDNIEKIKEEFKEEIKLENEESINDNDIKVEDVEEKDIPKKTKTITEEKWEKINSEPIWSKASSDVSEQEYEDFYKSISNDWDKQLTHTHFKMEGNIEFTSLLYIPARAPYDLFERSNQKKVKLYVKKVLISDDCKDLCPDWMNFVSGIVDSNDLPLNASRELLQQSKILKQINKHLVKKTIEMITNISEDKEKYIKFYENFDKNIKLAIHEEESLREKLVEFLRYTTSTDKMVSLSDYKNRMGENQPGIYYITGETIKGLENSPFVDKLKKKNWEIIYMTDPIDEYIIQHLKTYKEIKLINVSKDDLSIPEESVDSTQYEMLCAKIKEQLRDKIDTVVVSTKIESQPAIITNPIGMSANMERILRAQALSNKNANPMYGMMMNKRNMEINPNHQIMKKINNIINENSESNELNSNENRLEDINRLIELVYESAMLSSGYQIEDINNYLKKVYEYVK